jgi:hypothetical protein
VKAMRTMVVRKLFNFRIQQDVCRQVRRVHGRGIRSRDFKIRATRRFCIADIP